jgi:hypothetical protein
MMSGKKSLSDEQKASFEKRLTADYPEYQLTSFIKPGIEAVTQELISAI